MSISPTHFLKHLDPSNYKEIKWGTLLEVDLLDAVVRHKCPICGHKLYPMSNGRMWWCKAKRCALWVNEKKHFMIKSEKLG